jgi:hypothetical protein
MRPGRLLAGGWHAPLANRLQAQNYGDCGLYRTQFEKQAAGVEQLAG